MAVPEPPEAAEPMEPPKAAEPQEPQADDAPEASQASEVPEAPWEPAAPEAPKPGKAAEVQEAAEARIDAETASVAWLLAVCELPGLLLLLAAFAPAVALCRLEAVAGPARRAFAHASAGRVEEAPWHAVNLNRGLRAEGCCWGSEAHLRLKRLYAALRCVASPSNWLWPLLGFDDATALQELVTSFRATFAREPERRLSGCDGRVGVDWSHPRVWSGVWPGVSLKPGEVTVEWVMLLTHLLAGACARSAGARRARPHGAG